MNEEKTLVGQLDEIRKDMKAMTGVLYTLENSLLHSKDRKDMDMTEPAAATSCIVAGVISELSDKLHDIVYELEKDRGEA